MSIEILYAIISTVLISSVTLVGIVLFWDGFKKFHNLLTAIVSFAAGALLGDVFFHLLAEHIEEFGFENETIWAILAGITVSLIVEAVLHCSHDSEEEIHHHHTHANPALAKISLIGDGVHNFLDGIAIMASFLVSIPAGIATTAAIILHEIPQELADAGVLLHAGWAKRKVLIANFLIGLVAVAGAISAALFTQVFGEISKYLIPFAAGQFIYIAAADLLPEIHRKSGVKKYIIEIGMFITGLIVMYSLTLME